jgi:hypothetical protein
MKDDHSESLRMLEKTIGEEKFDPLVLDFGDGWGDILLIEYIHLEPPYRGYGIGLLAVDMFMQQMERASSGWSEGVIIVDASGLESGVEPGHSRREVQGKLVRHWQLLGLQSHSPEFDRRKGKRCRFVGHYMAYGWQWRDIATVVPHLFTSSTRCDTADVRPTTRKRNQALDDLEELLTGKRARLLQNNYTKLGIGFSRHGERL